MKKWMFSAILYLLVVVIGYSIYAAFISNDPTEDSSHGGHGEATTKSESHGDHGGQGTSNNSEVNVEFLATSTEMTISLLDSSGDPVQLEINHEKLLHLIIVNEHLDQYFHLHPEEVSPGTFVIKKSLDIGTYKAFIDIKPKNLAYSVEPHIFSIGEKGGTHGGHQMSLKADSKLTKTVNGVEVQLTPTSLMANEEVSLTFEFPNDETLQTYLGAMGHVVILDELGEKFVHVHPVNENEAVFVTEFEEPGIYKLWAEFQIDGEVYTYPFIVEIE